MLNIENVSVFGWDSAIRGMRNPMNSWDRSDSSYSIVTTESADGTISEFPKFFVGENDLSLMRNLAKAGNDHGKFLRMINVTLDITAPLYWWKEFDTYKVGTVANSCSTMHKIHSKRFERDDFSIEHLENCEEQYWMICMDNVISALNVARDNFLSTKDKKYWWQMIQLLPSSYNQRRTVQLNYAVLKNMYCSRKNHKLDEWHSFCDWIETLPYSELIVDRLEQSND